MSQRSSDRGSPLPRRAVRRRPRMRQVLFTIPILGGIKIFGYGLMLFLAFLGSMNLAAWRARREKLDPEVIYDLALWVFIGGLLGARLFYVDPVLGRRGSTASGTSSGSGRGGSSSTGASSAGRPRSSSTGSSGRSRSARCSTWSPPRWRWGSRSGGSAASSTAAATATVCDLPWAVSFPDESPPWRHQVASGLIAPRRRLVAARPPDPALLGARRPDPAAPALGLFPAPPPRRRGDGPPDGHLPDHAGS